MIHVEQVSKYYGAQRAVSGLSFSIPQGQCVGLLGLNGAGKSTTLRLLSCQALPTAGRITVAGYDAVAEPEAIRRLIGYLPDRPPLYDEMTVREYLGFAASLRGLGAASRTAAVSRALEMCDLGSVHVRPLGALSHGYRQRVGIAQAIIHSPRLLILDEPTQGLDPVQVVEMRAMIGQLRGEHTILLSTHMLSEIEQTCDRILMMHEGRIAASGSEAELTEQLQQTRRLSLTVRAPADALRELLVGLPACGAVRVDALGQGRCEAGLSLSGGRPEQVSRAVVEAGMDLLSMAAVDGGLESVFLRLSRALPPAGGEPGPAGNDAAAEGDAHTEGRGAS